jgi:hypothetical protein
MIPQQEEFNFMEDDGVRPPLPAYTEQLLPGRNFLYPSQSEDDMSKERDYPSQSEDDMSKERDDNEFLRQIVEYENHRIAEEDAVDELIFSEFFKDPLENLELSMEEKRHIMYQAALRRENGGL